MSHINAWKTRISDLKTAYYERLVKLITNNKSVARKASKKANHWSNICRTAYSRTDAMTDFHFKYQNFVKPKKTKIGRKPLNWEFTRFSHLQQLQFSSAGCVSQTVSDSIPCQQNRNETKPAYKRKKIEKKSFLQKMSSKRIELRDLK